MIEEKDLKLTESKQERLANSERFTKKVLSEFGSSIDGACEVSDFQKKLIQGYFICIDRALNTAEEERIRKNTNNKDHKYDNNLPVNWKTVDLNELALDLVRYARLGLDMTQENMLFPIPYKNNKKECYDITLMPGYNGIRYMAEKYALEKPKAVTIEVVYSTDKFEAIKKNADNRIENYRFEITKPFNRGEIIGGFGYIEFNDASKNELVIMSMADIMKRKPEYASANFWGGRQKVWENGKQVEVEKAGWLDEMVRKTLIREVYSAKHLPRDPMKIDENYQFLKMREAQYAAMEAEAEIAEKANRIVINEEQGETAPLLINAVTGEVAENTVETAAEF